MRVEPFTVGSYVHVLKRGARGMPITQDRVDQWRFIRLLYYMNDENITEWWEKDIKNLTMFERPALWKERKPIVKIICYTLMPNHFHLMLREIVDGGVSKFMKKLSESMSKYHNKKYSEKCSIFQGAYKGRAIENDEYLRYLGSYIMVKNVFELYPKGGLAGAIKNFEDAWNWAARYEFSSFADYASGRNSPVIDKDIVGQLLGSPEEFKELSRDVILAGKWLQNDKISKILLD